LDHHYLWLKSLHLFGVMIFMGNIIVTGWWKYMADRTRNSQVIAFAQRQVTLTDYVFTASGAAIVLAAGWTAAASQGLPPSFWLSWGLGLFTASGIIWAAILIPVQHRQATMAREFEASGIIPAEYWHLCRRWVIWGVIATVLPLFNIYLMVVKPI
jgi:uncharacterized membrane protein